ncbi:YkvA family protein [Ancylobacter sp. 6x-1]|uniref:YkvA family protein n=2 Tax=Ancylobacter crimeensis TaxID=2579147 RepID=A0ABT0DEM2_9HYPH|nr:YkvA family protein [Ancylobacter crimeensis]MCK0198418.1 YkvA family protein [Ancylobacter crimeensis]
MAAHATHIPFAADITAAYYCALDKDTPFRVRAALFGALAYFILPIDSVPDFLPFVGFTDDAAVLATALNLLAGHIAPRHREAAEAALARLRGSADAL